MKKLIILLTVMLLPINAFAIQSLPPVAKNSTSVILKVSLYDAANAALKASDVTNNLDGLKIITSWDDNTTPVVYECTGAACVTTDTFDDITCGTFGVYTNGAGFGWCSASRFHEIHLPNTAFAVAGANVLYIDISDGGTELVDTSYALSLNSIGVDTLLDALDVYDCSTNNTPNSYGYQLCTKINANSTTLGSIDSSVSSLNTSVGRSIPYQGSVDTGGVTSQTELILDPSFGYDNKWKGSMICIEDSDTGARSCTRVQQYVQGTGTVTLETAVEFTIAEGDGVFILPSDANVKYMNDTKVIGTGVQGDSWKGSP